MNLQDNGARQPLQTLPPKKPRTGLIIGIVAAVLILAGGIIATILLLGGGSKDEPSQASSQEESSSESSETVLPSESITVAENIAKRPVPIAIGSDGVILINIDEKVISSNQSMASEGWESVLSVAAASKKAFFLGLHKDGTLSVAGADAPIVEETASWNEIQAVDAGASHAVALRADGTVVAVGDEAAAAAGALSVEAWKDIIEVCAGDNVSYCLSDKGTVLCTDAHHAEIADWSNVIKIDAGLYHVIGLTKDGRVLASLDGDSAHDQGQGQAGQWTGIIDIAAGASHSVGLRADGTVVAAGDNQYGQCDVSTWTNVIAVFAGDDVTVGLQTDGTLLMTGKNDKGQLDMHEKLDPTPFMENAEEEAPVPETEPAEEESEALEAESSEPEESSEPASAMDEVFWNGYLQTELLPKKGLASLETSSLNIHYGDSYDGWDEREGIIGADLVDLTGDGERDLLVYSLEQVSEDSEAPDTVMFALLYYQTEEGVASSEPLELITDSNDRTTYTKLGLMDVQGETLLYQESYDSTPYYFTGGSSGGMTFTWYRFNGTALTPRYQGKVETFEGLNYTWTTWDEAGEATQTMILASELYKQYSYYTGESALPDDTPCRDAINYSFTILGLPEAPFEEIPHYLKESDLYPTFWDTEFMKPSVRYLCWNGTNEHGSDYDDPGMTLTVEIENRTGLPAE